MKWRVSWMSDYIIIFISYLAGLMMGARSSSETNEEIERIKFLEHRIQQLERKNRIQDKVLNSLTTNKADKSVESMK